MLLRRWQIVLLAGGLIVNPFMPVAFASGTEFSTPAPSATDDIAAGKAALAAGDWKRAVAELAEARSLDPRNADIYNLLGYAYRSAGDLDHAFENYDRALQLNPRHLGAHSYLGIAYLKADNLTKAKEHLDALYVLCKGQCKEYGELKDAITAYQGTHPQ